MAKETIGRNDPCPCGSGKKYKVCCIDKPTKVSKRRLWIGLALAAVAAVAGVVIGMQTSMTTGLLSGTIGVVAVGTFMAISNPVPSRGRKGADNINFGN